MATLRPKTAAGKKPAKRTRKQKRPLTKRAPAGKSTKSGRRAQTAVSARRTIEAALAGIAHDIRTPLTGVVALAELLAASDLNGREREWANAIKRGADHLAALTSLIVDAVKADAAKLVLRREPFAPRALAEAVGQALSARAGNKGIRAVVDVAADLPDMVTGDATRLRAALENLADNAVKFTNEGLVTFGASVEAASRGRLRLVFTLSDSGIGMTAAEIKRLFRPFAQASESIARRYGGAGLGLTFVKRIANAMGGDLSITSQAGKGSTFRLTALVAPADPLSSGPTPRSRPSQSLSILCVEDNPYGRVVMNTILQELGHTVDFVDNGDAAVTAVQRGAYDAVLMDITLPGIDGLEATRRIRALRGETGQVTVIGISGRDGSDEAAKARVAGMSDYLVKPISPRTLAQALAAAGQQTV